MPSHDNHRALVTGAGSGIGRGIAHRLAAEGAAVAVVDVNAEAAAAVVDEIESADGKAVAITADVRDRAAVRAAVSAAAQALGGLDLLVNNAGLVTMSPFEETTDDEWDLVMDVNCKGMFVVTQEALPHLREAGDAAAVVNLSTVEAEVVVSSGGSCQVHYNASKGGVKMLTKALAAELSRYGIRVNAVAPGPVATGFVPGMSHDDPDARAFMDERLLIKRSATPADIAGAVSFLLSADASFITGVQLPVDGGWLVR
ncbi:MULTISPECIES: SDR family NAD(P)-dependent oxidoreductase [Actinomadura]|uniref:3-oxoacyl-[acyl-carrier protein] reductase n=1 Tax=Actinomadura madurae TaxID=1993 RepID=A0A1I5PGB5_9ACTN|nr:SDR family NAD(P)-dependent oxidoreductase [Actinomadura madurae]SFP32850.1 3-oxoacyl-[acyl-carrier protein] reductase [Actinomadura madurae]SPT63918.1 Pyridoxal 4-dehydrogenase [Actinomadura madurae]